MIITALDEGVFKVQTGGVVLATEAPEAEKTRIKPDIFLRTSSHETDLPDAEFIVKGPGEYELHGIEITGIEPYTYIVKSEDVKLCFLSSADQKALDNLTNIDLVFVSRMPQENHGALGSFIRQLAPRIVIASENTAHPLGKELGAQPEKLDKVTIKKRELPADGMKFICLTTA